MSRIAILVGRSDAGELKCLGIGEGNGITDVMKLREDIYKAAGVVRLGNREIRLTELRTIANATAGGELKTPLKWAVAEPAAKKGKAE